MKFLEAFALLVAGSLAGANLSHADQPNSLTFDTMSVQLEALQKQMDNLSARLEDIAKDIAEMKKCDILSRRRPLTLGEIKSDFKSNNESMTKESEATLSKMLKQDMYDRAKCGLTPR